MISLQFVLDHVPSDSSRLACQELCHVFPHLRGVLRHLLQDHELRRLRPRVPHRLSRAAGVRRRLPPGYRRGGLQQLGPVPEVVGRQRRFLVHELPGMLRAAPRRERAVRSEIPVHRRSSRVADYGEADRGANQETYETGTEICVSLKTKCVVFSRGRSHRFCHVTRALVELCLARNASKKKASSGHVD